VCESDLLFTARYTQPMRWVWIGFIVAVVALLVGCGGSKYAQTELDAARNFIQATKTEKSEGEVIEMARSALKDAGARVSVENVKQVLEGAHLTDPSKGIQNIPDIARQVAAYEKGELAE